MFLSIALPPLTLQFSDAEEKYTRSQAHLNQTFAFLDSVHTLNSSLNAQLDSEKIAYEVIFLTASAFDFLALMLSAIFAWRNRDEHSLALAIIWTDYIAMLAIP